jgi:hypothetical protein
MDRAEILDKAKEAVADREGKYGSPRENFERIARRWNAHLVNVGFRSDSLLPELTADDVAAMLIDVKLARAESGVYHPDNFIDVAGYAALAAEIGGPHDSDRDLYEWERRGSTLEVGVDIEEVIADLPRKRKCICDVNLMGDNCIIASNVHGGCPLHGHIRRARSK